MSVGRPSARSSLCPRVTLTDLKGKGEPLYQYASQFPVVQEFHSCKVVSISILLRMRCRGCGRHHSGQHGMPLCPTIPIILMFHIDWEDERNEGDAWHNRSPLDILLNPRVANGVTLELLSAHRESIKEYSKENGFSGGWP